MDIDWLTIGKNFGLPVVGALGGWIATSMGVKGRVQKVEAGLTALRKGWRLELDSARNDTEDKLDELKKQLNELQKQFQEWQRESSSFASDEEMSRFIEETQKQWQLIQRTLGQIEGMMKRLP